MRILAVYRHYWPDATPYARLLRAILEDQVAAGREATVFTAQPGYNDVKYASQPSREIINGVEVRRIRLLPERKHLRFLRALNYFYFVLRAIWHVLLTRRYEIILANTHPPILMGWGLRVIRQIAGIPYLLHCQDIHPESAVLGKRLRKGWLYRCLQTVDTKNCSTAKRVITLSEDMKRTLLSRKNYDATNISVVNNFALDRYQEVGEPTTHFKFDSPDLFQVFFAGNMGDFQGLGRLMEAAKLLRDESNIKFVLMGAGSDRLKLLEMAGDLLDKTVFFESFKPVEVAFACMQRADLGVVSLLEGVCKVAYPSKTMTYLAAGCPLLSIIEPDSQVANEVLDHKFGYVPTTTAPRDIASCILYARSDRSRWSPAEREKLTSRASKLFGRERSLQEWRAIFRKCAETHPAKAEAPTSQKEVFDRLAA